jgi:transcriptional regulator with XRE-family HTH domain
LECLRDASRLEALGFTRNAISDAVHGGRGYVNRLISGERKDISMDKAFLLLENLKIPLFTEINKEKMVGRLDLKDRSGTELKLMMENTELKEENEFLKRENEILKKVIGEKELELMNLRMKS